MAIPWLQWSQNTKVEKSKEEANEASHVLYYVIDKKILHIHIGKIPKIFLSYVAGMS